MLYSVLFWGPYIKDCIFGLVKGEKLNKSKLIGKALKHVLVKSDGMIGSYGSIGGKPKSQKQVTRTLEFHHFHDLHVHCYIYNSNIFVCNLFI